MDLTIFSGRKRDSCALKNHYFELGFYWVTCICSRGCPEYRLDIITLAEANIQTRNKGGRQEGRAQSR